MRIDDVKYCTRCKSFKLVLEFNRNQHWCRACQAAIWAARKSAKEVA